MNADTGVEILYVKFCKDHSRPILVYSVMPQGNPAGYLSY